MSEHGSLLFIQVIALMAARRCLPEDLTPQLVLQRWTRTLTGTLVWVSLYCTVRAWLSTTHNLYLCPAARDAGRDGISSRPTLRLALA